MLIGTKPEDFGPALSEVRSSIGKLPHSVSDVAAADRVIRSVEGILKDITDLLQNLNDRLKRKEG